MSAQNHIPVLIKFKDGSMYPKARHEDDFIRPGKTPAEVVYDVHKSQGKNPAFAGTLAHKIYTAGPDGFEVIPIRDIDDRFTKDEAEQIKRDAKVVLNVTSGNSAPADMSEHLFGTYPSGTTITIKIP